MDRDGIRSGCLRKTYLNLLTAPRGCETIDQLTGMQEKGGRGDREGKETDKEMRIVMINI